MAIGFNDSEATTPLELDADQLPNGEGFMNADEGFSTSAQDLATEVEEALEGSYESGALHSNIIRKVRERFEEADRTRYTDEQRWLDAYQNYRGRYAKNEKFTEHEKSRVFVKATKTKVLAAYGQLIDVLFGTDKFPISISETEVPEGAKKFVHFNPAGQSAPGIENGMGGGAMPIMPEAEERNPYDVGYAGDGLDVAPGAKFEDITVGLSKKYADAADKMQEGHSDEGMPTLKPAHEAAMRMQKLIHDQIAESDGGQALRNSMFEACLLGTGIIKGPFTSNKTLHKWSNNPETGNREYKPEKVKVPRIEFCSIWDAFPDPNADCMNEAEWFIQRHKLSRSQLRALASRPYFNADAIADAIRMGPNYVNKDFENELQSENNEVQPNLQRYEVLEYWGTMDKEDLEHANIDVSNYDALAEIQINAWVCHGKLLRVVVNPFTPARIPYLAFDYERNPYSFFGIGVAENMSDSQSIMNGHARMAIDNLALAGSMVFDVDENALVPGQDMSIYPGKVFKRQSGAAGQAIYGLTFPNTAPENLQMFDKFRQIADETTGIPSYAHGQTGVMSTTRTAAGMSMLMGAASLNVKTVVKNIDDFLLKPLGEAMFQWNMSFYEGELEIVGDLEVKAGGAASLMQNEVRSQRLTNFGQLLQNPAIAPWIDVPAYIRAFVESLELDADEFINDQEKAMIMAEMMGQAGGLGGQAPLPGVNMTGGGETGAIPAPAQPESDSFSGTPGGEG